MDRKYFGFCQKKFGRIVQTEFYVSIGTVQWKTFFKKETFILFPIVSRYWARFLWPFVEVFWRCGQNCTVSVQRNFFTKRTFFWEKNVLLEFFDHERKTFWFFQKNFYMSRGIFSEKKSSFSENKNVSKIIFGHWAKTFRVLSKKLLRCGRNCFLLSGWTTWAFFSEFFFIFSWTLGAIESTFSQIFLQGFQKCFRPVPGINLSFVRKKSTFVIFLGF